MMRHKKGKKLLVIMVVFCLILSTMSINSFARGARGGHKSKNNSFRYEKWFKGNKDKNQEKDSTNKEETNEDIVTSDEENNSDINNTEESTTNNEASDNSNVIVEQESSDAYVENVATSNNIGYVKKSNSGSVSSSAKTCSSVSEFQSAINSANPLG